MMACVMIDGGGGMGSRVCVIGLCVMGVWLRGVSSRWLPLCH